MLDFASNTHKTFGGQQNYFPPFYGSVCPLLVNFAHRGEQFLKKGGNMFVAHQFFMCIRCKIQHRLWFCHQTWPNFMIWPTYGRSHFAWKRGAWFLKKGGIFCWPPNFLCVLDAKFNVDYDFAIKHDLIPWSDQLMGVHSLHEKGGHNS